MGMSSKIIRGQATPQGKPTCKPGPNQKASIVTPKSKGTTGKKGG